MKRPVLEEPPPPSLDPTTQYAQDVVDGKIIAGPPVRDACKRHLRDLEEGPKRGYMFDREEAQTNFDFFEEILRLNGGEFENKPFVLEPSQKFIVGCLFGWKTLEGVRRFRQAYIEEGKGNGKALAFDTPIPTPKGWSTMGKLKVGDEVFDEKGKVCKVLATTKLLRGRPCYRLTFDDGEQIVADANHLWKTNSHKHGVGIRTTEEIEKTLRRKNGKYRTANHRIPLAGALDLPEADLPIPPYTLGAWLGDGNSDGAMLCCSLVDEQILETIAAEGVSVRLRKLRTSDTPGYGDIGGFRLGSPGFRGKEAYHNSLQAKLRKLGLIKNKHIPDIYLRSSRQQRAEVLAGLLDTDGTISKSGQVELCLMRKELIEDAFELIASLGFKPTLTESDAVLNGRVVGRRFRLQFWPNRPVFHLNRKAIRTLSTQWQPFASRRLIVGCEPVDSVLVKCISVSSESQMYLAGRSMIPTHNSPLVAGIGIKMLVADCEPRAEVYAAATKRDQAQVLFRDAVAMVDLSPELDRVLKRTGGTGHEWNIAHEESGSFFRTLASDDSQSGPRPHCGLLDEVHEHKSSLMVDMMRLGTKGRRQPLILMITNSGSDKQSVCWRYHDYAIKVCSGMLEDDTFFGYVCSLDIDDEPFDDESCWIKVNPLLGVSIKKEYLREQVREAKGMPSKASRVRRLNFCQWVDSANPWLPDHVWLAARDADFDEAKLRNRPAYGGLDLSSTLALTAFVLEFEPTEYDPFWRQKAWFWLPQDSVERIGKDYQLDFLQAWIASGFITVTKGSAVNKLIVLSKLVSLCSQYNVRAIGYDRWRIEDLKMLMDEEGVKLPLIEFGQGYKDMSPAVEAYEAKISNGQIKHDGNPVLTWNVSSVVIDSDPANNRKLTKAGSTGLIDGAVAMVMAEGVIGKTPPPVRHQFFALGRGS